MAIGAARDWLSALKFDLDPVVGPPLQEYSWEMSSTAVTWIVIGVIVVLVLWIISIYNGLVAKRQTVNEAFSGIDVQLKLRRELVPNLVETVKGYAAHEKSTLDAVKLPLSLEEQVKFQTGS